MSDIKRIFGRNLSRLLEEHHETQAELAEKMHVAPSSVSGWCTGAKMPRMNKVEWLASHFNVSRADLIEDHTSQLPTNAIPYSPTQRIPILGRISAGLPLYAEEQIEGYTYTDLNHGGEYFALRVKGDSMNAARINENDLLIVRKQDMVENGEIAVVMVGDDEATVKRFYQTDSTVTLMPQSTNPSHKPQIYSLKQTPVHVVGKVVQNQIAY